MMSYLSYQNTININHIYHGCSYDSQERIIKNFSSITRFFGKSLGHEKMSSI